MINITNVITETFPSKLLRPSDKYVNVSHTKVLDFGNPAHLGLHSGGYRPHVSHIRDYAVNSNGHA